MSASVSKDGEFLQQAIQLAVDNIKLGGRPFGAVIVKDGQIVSTGVNQISESGDPTSHAELNAVRKAAQILKSTSLKGCVVYASGQPCPMCLAAMRMTGIDQIMYAYSNNDAEPYGLSTAAIAEKLQQDPHSQEGLSFTQLKPDTDVQLYSLWKQSQ